MIHQLLTAAPLLAQASEEGGRGYSISWAIIVLSVVLGVYVAVKPAKREDRVEKPKAE